MYSGKLGVSQRLIVFGFGFVFLPYISTFLQPCKGTEKKALATLEQEQ